MTARARFASLTFASCLCALSAVQADAGRQAPQQPATTAAAQRDDAWKRCKAQESDVSIAGCTQLIDGGKESPQDLAAARYNRGLAFLTKNENARALADFNEGIRLDPADPDQFFQRARVYYHMDEDDRALMDYTRVIVMDPKYSAAHYNRALIFENARKEDLAIEDFDNYIALEPQDADGFEHRADAYFRKGQFPLALADFTQATTVDEANARALYGRGAAKQMTGDTAGGQADMAAAVKARADIVKVMAGVGVVVKASDRSAR